MPARPPVLRRVILALSAGVAVIVLLAVSALGAVALRIETFEIESQPLTSSEPLRGVTYLFVGSDGEIERAYDDVQNTDTGRADSIVLVHLQPGSEAVALSIPRDLVVVGRDKPERMALTLMAGQSELIDAVCSTLGVTVDRYVEIDAVGFVEAIDALGGVSVFIEWPLRDERAALELSEAGAQVVDGEQALALVRSRHPEQLKDGEWVAIDEAAGANERSKHTVEVLEAVRSTLSRAQPLTVLNAVWQASDNLTVGGGLHPQEWKELAGLSLHLEVLETQPLGKGLALQLQPGAEERLRALGFGTNCSIA